MIYHTRYEAVDNGSKAQHVNSADVIAKTAEYNNSPDRPSETDTSTIVISFSSDEEM